MFKRVQLKFSSVLDGVYKKNIAKKKKIFFALCIFVIGCHHVKMTSEATNYEKINICFFSSLQ